MIRKAVNAHRCEHGAARNYTVQHRIARFWAVSTAIHRNNTILQPVWWPFLRTRHIITVVRLNSRFQCCNGIMTHCVIYTKRCFKEVAT